MPTLSSRLDQLASAATRSDAPGLAFGVLRDGDVLIARGYGLADMAQHTPITEKTVFHLASTSKQFVACGVALLAAQRALALNDDMRTYLPEMPAYGAPITLHHLIHHQSGLRECLTLWSLTGRDRVSCGPPEEVLALVARQQRLHFLPGAAYEYCNTNYLLLALIIERCSGQPLATFAQQRIFQPLGMISSVIADDRSLIASPQACGYLATSEGARPAPGGIGVAGAAGVFSSVEDLIRWDQNFAQPIVGDARLVADRRWDADPLRLWAIRPGLSRPGGDQPCRGLPWHRRTAPALPGPAAHGDLPVQPGAYQPKPAGVPGCRSCP
jgi:CubicO group peptidase (beta-lactamase class C family)